MVITDVDAIYAVGGAALAFLANRVRRRVPTGPVCQCGHGYVHHDAETAACRHVESKYESRYEIDRNSDGTPVRDRWSEVERTTRTVHVGDTACTCQTYIRAEHRHRKGTPR